MFTRKKIIAATAALALALPAYGQSSGEVRRKITQITDDVYRFDNNFHVSMFVLTGDGVVMGDPINAEAAAWVEAEIAKLTDQPVTHLIMSHSHQDHTTGGQVFEDTATVITHALFPEAIAAGQVDTAMPDRTFEDQLTLEVGTKTFELSYLGPDGHGEDMIATVVRPDNVAFVVDVVSPKRLPFRTIGAGSIDGLLGQIRAVEALDFDILLPGHSVTGNKQDATDMRIYLETLREQVQAGLDEGKAVDVLKAEITMADYAEWGAYEQFLPLNIEGMVGHLSN